MFVPPAVQFAFTVHAGGVWVGTVDTRVCDTSWFSQKRSAIWAAWLACVCTRLAVETWSVLVTLRMTATDMMPMITSMSIAMMSEMPRAGVRWVMAGLTSGGS